MPRRWSVVRWFGVTVGVLVVVVVIGLVAAFGALHRLGVERRNVADRFDPAISSALQLGNAALNEETGVRGYALTRQASFLEPYHRGRRDEAVALAALRGHLRGTRADLGAAVERTDRALSAWRTGFAEPLIAGRRPSQDRGKALFDRFRAVHGHLVGALRTERAGARRRLASAAREVELLLILFGVVLLTAVVLAAVLLRQVVVAPLARLAGAVRHVVKGEFRREVRGDGAREVVDLARDVDAMRSRILVELEALSAARDELERSNAELEQFAYVASHDLQEPLRKVASFTQMLQRRYEGQLDERADRYIEFAVDGAKRMQTLINDLLAFSRVGRLSEPEAVVESADLVRRAESSLSALLEETGGAIETGELPPVRGEAGLLALVFQNLIGNGLKFRGEAPPRIRIDAEPDGPLWCFTVSDNGIGIESEYADRIFVIFQRLHPRTSYEGTGIGLAMCRKIVEHHGGRIWLDTERRDGATFHFTLPGVVTPAADGAPAPHPDQEATPA